MKKLSEILKTIEELHKEYERIDATMKEGETKEDLLTNISLRMDCLDTLLMYGDYINDTGRDYNYWED